jgi:hypothetical protein
LVFVFILPSFLLSLGGRGRDVCSVTRLARLLLSIVVPQVPVPLFSLPDRDRSPSSRSLSLSLTLALALASLRLADTQVYIDGGARRGTDVIKALCLGAKGVGMGRPFLYSLTYGEEGVVHAIESMFYLFFIPGLG